MKVGVPKGSAKTVGGVLLAVINGHYIKNRAYTMDTHRVSVVYTMGHTVVCPWYGYGYITVVLGTKTSANNRGIYHGTHGGGWHAYSASIAFSPPLGLPYWNVA